MAASSEGTIVLSQLARAGRPGAGIGSRLAFALVAGAGPPARQTAFAQRLRLGAVPMIAAGYAGLVMAALTGWAWLTIGALAVATLGEWVATVLHNRVLVVLTLAGAHPAVRTLIRAVLVLVAFAHSGMPWQALAGVGAVSLAMAMAGIAHRMTSAWLGRRQPLLLFAPAGRPQPPVTADYARIHGASQRLLPDLLVVEWAAALVAVVCSALPALAFVTLLLAALLAGAAFSLPGALKARSMSSMATAHEAAVLADLKSQHPGVIVYSSAGAAESNYILNQWIDTFDHIAQPCYVLVREGAQLGSIKPTDLPIVYGPTTRHVEEATVPSVQAAFYLANAGKNVHLLREARIKHVFLNHGDSDKSTSANPVVRGYDEVWVAGRAAIDRYQAAGVRLPDRQFAIVGRPQVEGLRVGPLDNERPIVLYAPTFEGYYEQSNYSSLERMGPQLVASILRDFPSVVIWFKPHPASGVQRSGMVGARRAIEQMLREADAPHLNVDTRPDMSLQDAFDQADVVISDISSVVTDFLQTQRPIITSNPRELPLDLFTTTFPTQSGSYVLERDLSNLDTVLTDALGEDSMAAARAEAKRYVLGDLTDTPTATFSANVDRLVEQARVDAAAIQNMFRIAR